MRPLESHSSRLESSALTISPPHSLRWCREALGNSVAQVSFSAPATRLRIESELTIASLRRRAARFRHRGLRRRFSLLTPPASRSTSGALRSERLFQRACRRSRLARSARPVAAAGRDLCAAYPAEYADRGGFQLPGARGRRRSRRRLRWRSGSGSCRILRRAVHRSLPLYGLAARFVSGYLHMPEDDREMPRRTPGPRRNTTSSSDRERHAVYRVTQ